MLAIAVDDEVLMLGALVKAITASPDIREVTKFSDCEKALEYVKGNPVDIAFLDINTSLPSVPMIRISASTPQGTIPLSKASISIRLSFFQSFRSILKTCISA